MIIKPLSLSLTSPLPVHPPRVRAGRIYNGMPARELGSEGPTMTTSRPAADSGDVSRSPSHTRLASGRYSMAW
ncbi:hypothetical protein SHIRM173S_07043 [Streptomyces hirsutus]